MKIAELTKRVLAARVAELRGDANHFRRVFAGTGREDVGELLAQDREARARVIEQRASSGQLADLIKLQYWLANDEEISEAELESIMKSIK